MQRVFSLVAIAGGLWLVAASQLQAMEPRANLDVNVPATGIHVQVATGNEIPVSRATELVGLPVYNPNNQDIGKIEDLVISPATGRVRYAVMSFGGFLGVGNKLFAVPWSELRLMPKKTAANGIEEQDHYVLNVTREALQQAPGFDRLRWPNFSDPKQTAAIERFYGEHRVARGQGTMTK
jgi:sporulation protein YlmC with PRC-barrel domain